MGRKRNPYIQLFTRDILSSPRCRALSESAAGVYLFLLCRLNEPPTPGAYRISDWELHPTWKRSCTQQCLATSDKQARLQYFAKMLSKNDLPWKTATILQGLQELYKYGIITVEGDMLIQPRMFKDNGFELPDLDNDGDPVGTILDDPVSGSMALRGDDDFIANNGAENSAVLGTQNGTKKEPKKVRNSHAGAPDSIMRVEPMRNNIDKGNKGGVGGDAPNANQMQKPCKNKETDENNPVVQQFNDFWTLYDKKSCNYPGTLNIWMKMSAADRDAALAFVSTYLRLEPTRKYRKAPANYLHERLWESEDLPDHSTVRGRKGDKEMAPIRTETAQDGLSELQTDNLPQTENKPVKSPKNKSKGTSVVDNPPTLDEIQAYMDERAAQGKPFIYVTAEGFLDACEQSGWTLKDGKPIRDWRARLRTFENYRKEHGDRPIGQSARQPNRQGSGQTVPPPKAGDPVAATKPTGKKYKDKW